MKEIPPDFIDICMQLQDDPELKGSVEAIFRKIMADYFFGDTRDSKSVQNLIANLPLPECITGKSSVFDIREDDAVQFVSTETINESVAGRVYLSAEYLKAFYPNQTPSFSKMPNDIKEKIFAAIKDKNQSIIDSFARLHTDLRADKNRRILSLVALILKKIHLESEFPLNKLDQSADALIREIFDDIDAVFTASPRQMAMLRDDAAVKKLVKVFFGVKKFQDMNELAALFKAQLEKYSRRTLRQL